MPTTPFLTKEEAALTAPPQPRSSSDPFPLHVGMRQAGAPYSLPTAHPPPLPRILLVSALPGTGQGQGSPLGSLEPQPRRGWEGKRGKQRCVLKSASFWPRLNFQAAGLTDRRGKGAPAPRGAPGRDGGILWGSGLQGPHPLPFLPALSQAEPGGLGPLSLGPGSPGWGVKVLESQTGKSQSRCKPEPFQAVWSTKAGSIY